MRIYWSTKVTKHDHPEHTESGVFALKDPKQIARSIKRSAEKVGKQNRSSYQSAMSRLTFYINRAGKNLPKSQLNVLNQAKAELRKLYGRS